MVSEVKKDVEMKEKEDERIKETEYHGRGKRSRCLGSNCFSYCLLRDSGDEDQDTRSEKERRWGRDSDRHSSSPPPAKRFRGRDSYPPNNRADNANGGDFYRDHGPRVGFQQQQQQHQYHHRDFRNEYRGPPPGMPMWYVQLIFFTLIIKDSPQYNSSSTSFSSSGMWYAIIQTVYGTT